MEMDCLSRYPQSNTQLLQDKGCGYEKRVVKITRAQLTGVYFDVPGGGYRTYCINE